jgi:imidazolonepropionase-like amidohydrolase
MPLSVGLEVRRMVFGGLSPADVLVSATSVAAGALGLAGHVGTIAEGKLADLLVVDGDPLAAPELLDDPARIWLVLQLGTPVAGTSV